jgi:DnaJ family protein C protein 10
MRLLSLSPSSFLIYFGLFIPFIFAVDYYELLGVSKDADDRTIRKAFKKLAILKHPDKNKDDLKAHEEFVIINRAYEVLKDEELRKKYDQWGEEGLKDDFQGGNQQYQSYQFYRDNFGIYDDDQEIVTLSRSDFQQSVIDSGDLWFVNFYSTFCSHCHDLAPTWREFAREMEGVVRIGAVNCAEDPMLCQSQNVMGYPSLVLYPNNLFYQGPRTLKGLTDFVMQKIVAEIHRITFKNYLSLSTEWEKYAPFPWVIDFCEDEESCLSKINRRKLASMLKGLANVGYVTCPEHKRDLLCKKLRDNGIAFYPAGQLMKEQEHEIDSFDPKEIYSAVLNLLPEWNELSDEEYEKVLEGNDETTLLRFFDGSKEAEDLSVERELKKLPMMFPDITTKRVDCSKMTDICSELNLKTEDLPRFILFKPGGGYEINYSKKQSVHDLATFIRESRQSIMITLTEEKYNTVIRNEEELWIVDFGASWCPPCMKLIPQIRGMPDRIGDIPLHTGTLDCVTYKHICQKAGISSYPTTMIYYKGQKYQMVGYHTSEQIVEFISDALNPSVEVLNPTDFEDLVLGRAEGVTFVVDFFAPWCSPCQQLAPEFRKLARNIKSDNEDVRFGSVDCDAHRGLCQSQGITGYPAIRLYRHKLHQKPLDYPTNWWRDHRSMQRWVTEFLPSLVEQYGQEFYDEVLASSSPWVVDFYAPWCGHCIQFAPVYEKLAKYFEGRVKFAKVDCDRYPGVCQNSQIRAYPTIRFYIGSKNGERQNPLGMHVQSQNYDAFIQIIETALNHYRRDEL